MVSPSVGGSGGGLNLWTQMKQRQVKQPAQKEPVAAAKAPAAPSNMETKQKALATKAKSQQMRAMHTRMTDKASKKQQISQRLKTMKASTVDGNSQQLGSQLSNIGGDSDSGQFIRSLGDSGSKVNQGGLAAELQNAKKKLKKVSQHQVLNLGDISSGSTAKESVISRKMGSDVGGVSMETATSLPGPEGSIDIVGHSSEGGMKIEGKSPQELAAHLKTKFGLQQIKTINLVSCESEQFKTQFQEALQAEGIEVGEVTAPQGRVAVDRASGQMLDEAKVGDLSKISGHDGALGKLSDRDVQTIIDNFKKAGYTITSGRIRVIEENLDHFLQGSGPEKLVAEKIKTMLPPQPQLQQQQAPGDGHAAMAADGGAQHQQQQVRRAGGAADGGVRLQQARAMQQQQQQAGDMARLTPEIMDKIGDAADVWPDPLKRVKENPDKYLDGSSGAKMQEAAKIMKMFINNDPNAEEYLQTKVQETQQLKIAEREATHLKIANTLLQNGLNISVEDCSDVQAVPYFGVVCHQFAFNTVDNPLAEDPEDSNYLIVNNNSDEPPDSFDDLKTRAGAQTIAVCFQDGEVSHTAKWDGTKYHQALQGDVPGEGQSSVIFKTDLKQLTDASTAVLVYKPGITTKADWEDAQKARSK